MGYSPWGHRESDTMEGLSSSGRPPQKPRAPRDPRATHRFSELPTPATLSVDFDKLILKFIWKSKGPKSAKTVVKKNRTGRFTFFIPNLL